MSCKNTIMSCASAIALSLAMAQSASAEEAAAEAAVAAEAPTAAEPAVPAAAPAVEAVPAEAPAVAVPPPPPMSLMPSLMEPPEIPPEVIERREQHRKEMAKSPEERWDARHAELNKRYEDLRARAAESGMNFPESAPWDREPEWLSYDEMRKQMQGRGIELPEQPAWPGRMGMSDEERQAARDAMQEKISERRKMQEKMAAMTPEEREAFREQRYQEMRERAASRGMELPEQPAWPGRMGMSDEERQAARDAMQEKISARRKMQEKMAAMTPEEREAFWEQRYQEMRERAASRGIELRETPPWKQPLAGGPKPAPALPEPPAKSAEADWDKYQEIIAGMSPEEREACMAMHRMHMQQRMQRPPQPMAPPQGYGPGYGYGQGYGQGYGPGYGYGSGRGYGPRWGQWQGYPEWPADRMELGD